MGFDNPAHIAILLILLLLVFGAKRLPEIGRSLGSGMRGFKDSLSGAVSSELTAGSDAVTANQNGQHSVTASKAVLETVPSSETERSL
jgi:sec-independent protein translocase protein TatA